MSFAWAVSVIKYFFATAFLVPRSSESKGSISHRSRGLDSTSYFLIFTFYFAHEETHPSRRYFGWNRHVYLDVDRAHGLAARRSRHPRNSESTGGPGRH